MRLYCIYWWHCNRRTPWLSRMKPVPAFLCQAEDTTPHSNPCRSSGRCNPWFFPQSQPHKHALCLQKEDGCWTPPGPKAAAELNSPWSLLVVQPACPGKRKTQFRKLGSKQTHMEKCTYTASPAISLVTSESVSVSLKRAKSCPFWAYLAPTEMPVSMKLVTSCMFTLMLNLRQKNTKVWIFVKIKT